MRYELSDFEWTWYLESQIGIAAHPSRRPLRGLLRMRSHSLKHKQPHAEERATRASRSMGSKRLTDLSSSVVEPRFDRIGTGLQILDLTRFLDANQSPLHLKR